MASNAGVVGVVEFGGHGRDYPSALTVDSGLLLALYDGCEGAVGFEIGIQG